MALRQRGTDLVVAVGDPREVVARIVREVGATAVYVSRDHAPYGRGRDRAVAAAIEADGATWHGRRGDLVHEPDEVRTGSGGSFSVYSPFRRAWERSPRRPVQVLRRPSPAFRPDTARPVSAPIPGQPGPGRRPDGRPGAPAGARGGGRSGTVGTLAGRWPRTLRRRPRPSGPGRRTSRLSADLHLGSLSPLEVVERVLRGGRGPTGLHQRARLARVLRPRAVPSTRLRRRPSARSSTTSRGRRMRRRLDAWRPGRTGYPVVDAGHAPTGRHGLDAQPRADDRLRPS